MRERICLNGEWLFCPDYRGLTPEEATASPIWEQKRISIPSSWRWIMKPGTPIQTYDLFGYPARWNDAESGVLSRVFTVKQRSGRRVFLIFQGILQRNVVFVNGAKAAESVEGFLPLEIDVTELVRHGDNELTIWCGPWERLNTQSEPKLLVPGGSWFAKLARGIWQDVYLEYRPEVYITDVYVSTSVRSETITVEADVAGGAPGEGIQIKARVWDNGEAVCELGGDSGHFDGEGAARLTTWKHWPDAIRWSPENPHLSRLTIEAIKDGAVIDRAETRFGFREVWLDGHRLYLNGIRINLRGDAWHYQGFVQQTKEYALNWYRACRENGFNFVRLHAMPYPEFYLDAADEFGMLIMDESAIYGSGKDIQADHPVYLENCRRHLQALVRRDRNHPSIINWSMQNEMRWVDGRDGYKAAMPALAAAMRAMDGTRPISYDGDNRLVQPEMQEIVSMHYNIDGTVAGWDKRKPLVFGEHGKWHYLAPQICTDWGGPGAYLGLDACLLAISRHERHFLEYARREEVTGVIPFNFVNYMNEAMPDEDVPLSWDEFPGAGVRPRKITRYALTINNGLLPEMPLYRPNPSLEALRPALKPVAVIADQYDTSFYGGTELLRTFSIYNDTCRQAQAELAYCFRTASGEVQTEGVERFEHPPGERRELSLRLLLPAKDTAVVANLVLTLRHGGELVHELNLHYRIYPTALREHPLPSAAGKRLAFVGGETAYSGLIQLLPGLERWGEEGEWDFTGLACLIVGPDAGGILAERGRACDDYVAAGGSLLVLEQRSFAPGELALSGRRFFSAHIADRSHPVCAGLSEDDLWFWDPDNVSVPSCRFMVDNAFEKPSQGDVLVLLECGEGDFGWGGLLWTPLVEYRIGRGKVILNQVEIMENLKRVPQACMLLRNILGRLLEGASKRTAGIELQAEEDVSAFFARLGSVGSCDGERKVMVVDPRTAGPRRTVEWRDFAAAGGDVLVLPAEPCQAGFLRALTGLNLDLAEAPAYQVEALPHTLTKGLTAHDLYGYERVTYTQDKSNEPLCRYRIEAAPDPGMEVIFRGVRNHWHEFFVRGNDMEYLKAAVIAGVRAEAKAEPGVYGLSMSVGRGRVILCQIIPDAGREKIRRVYTRLLANLGAAFAADLLRRVKQETDYAVEAFMALPHDGRYPYGEMEAYFRTPGFTLNNLGEGIYGWMQRIEARGGRITVPASAGRTYFFTVFVESELNRDPARRGPGELPDSSIVPDLYLLGNCRARVFLNGVLRHEGDLTEAATRVEDTELKQGLNRLVLACQGGADDIAFSAWFSSKHGGPVEGLRYRMTLD